MIQSKDIDIVISIWEEYSDIDSIEEAQRELTGFSWDKTKWPSLGSKNVAKGFPTNFDPILFPVTKNDFISGYGDKDDLEYVGIKTRTKNDILEWNPVLKKGTFFNKDQEEFFYSNEYYSDLMQVKETGRELVLPQIVGVTSLIEDWKWTENELTLSNTNNIYPGSYLFIKAERNILVKVLSVDGSVVTVISPIKRQVVLNYLTLDWLEDESIRSSNYKYPNIVSSNKEGVRLLYVESLDSFIRLVPEIPTVNTRKAIEVVPKELEYFDKFSTLVLIGDWWSTPADATAASSLNAIGWIDVDSGELVVTPTSTGLYLAYAGTEIDVISCQTIYESNNSNTPITIDKWDFEDRFKFEQVDIFHSYVTNGIQLNPSIYRNINTTYNDFKKNPGEKHKLLLRPNEICKEYSIKRIYDEIELNPNLLVFTDENPLYFQDRNSSLFAKVTVEDDQITIDYDIPDPSPSTVYEQIGLQKFDGNLYMEDGDLKLETYHDVSAEADGFTICFYNKFNYFLLEVNDDFTWIIKVVENLEEITGSDISFEVGDKVYLDHKKLHRYISFTSPNGTRYIPYVNSSNALAVVTETAFFKSQGLNFVSAAKSFIEPSQVFLRDRDLGGVYKISIEDDGTFSPSLVEDAIEEFCSPQYLYSSEPLVDFFLELENGVVVLHRHETDSSMAPILDPGPAQINMGQYFGEVSIISDLGIETDLTGDYTFLYFPAEPVIRNVISFNLGEIDTGTITFSEKGIFKHRVKSLTDLIKTGYYCIIDQVLYLASNKQDKFGYLIYETKDQLLFNKNVIKDFKFSLPNLIGESTTVADSDTPAANIGELSIPVAPHYKYNSATSSFSGSFILDSYTYYLHNFVNLVGTITPDLLGQQIEEGTSATIVNVFPANNKVVLDVTFSSNAGNGVVYGAKTDGSIGYLHLSPGTSNFEIIAYNSSNPGSSPNRIGFHLYNSALQKNHFNGDIAYTGPSWEEIAQITNGVVVDKQVQLKTYPIIGDVVVYLFNPNNGLMELWEEVEVLDYSLASDKHFILNRNTGKMFFGNNIYGQKPKTNSLVLMEYSQSPSIIYDDIKSPELSTLDLDISPFSNMFDSSFVCFSEDLEDEVISTKVTVI